MESRRYSAVDVDVADRVQAHALYVHVIFPGRNYDHRELEFIKRHGGCEIEEGIHDAASKSEGQDIVTCCYAPGPHCTQSRTAHENCEQHFPTRPHPPWPRCTVR